MALLMNVTGFWDVTPSQIFVRKRQEKRAVDRTDRRWWDNIKRDIKELERRVEGLY